MKLNLSIGFELEQILKARWTRVLIKLILRVKVQNDPNRVYDLIKVGLR